MAGGTFYSFSFQLVNGLVAQDAVSVDISANGTAAISAAPMEGDSVGVLRRLPGSVVGDAMPLKIYGYGFPVKSIGQSTTYPGADNTITITLLSNVDLSGQQSSQLNISGLISATAGASPAISDTPILTGRVQSNNTNSSFVLSSSAEQVDGYYTGYTIVVDVDGDDTTANDVYYRAITSYTSSRVVTLNASVDGVVEQVSTYRITSLSTTVFGEPTSWVNSTGLLTLSVSPNQILEAGRLYVFSFVVLNPVYTPQGPIVRVSASGSVAISETVMNRDRNGVPGTEITSLGSSVTTLTQNYIEISSIAASGIQRGRYIRMQSEILLILQVDARVAVRRAQKGSDAQTHDVGEPVFSI
eukprot:859355-Rhodomonas_salina.1